MRHVWLILPRLRPDRQRENLRITSDPPSIASTPIQPSQTIEEFKRLPSLPRHSLPQAELIRAFSFCHYRPSRARSIRPRTAGGAPERLPRGMLPSLFPFSPRMSSSPTPCTSMRVFLPLRCCRLWFGIAAVVDAYARMVSTCMFTFYRLPSPRFSVI